MRYKAYRWDSLGNWEVCKENGDRLGYFMTEVEAKAIAFALNALQNGGRLAADMPHECERCGDLHQIEWFKP